MEEDIIQLDENLKKHLNDKTMKLDEKMLKFKDIYDNFKKKNYFKKIDICVYQTYFLILYNGFIYIFFFKLMFSGRRGRLPLHLLVYYSGQTQGLPLQNFIIILIRAGVESCPYK